MRHINVFYRYISRAHYAVLYVFKKFTTCTQFRIVCVLFISWTYFVKNARWRLSLFNIKRLKSEHRWSKAIFYRGPSTHYIRQNVEEKKTHRLTLNEFIYKWEDFIVCSCYEAILKHSSEVRTLGTRTLKK